MFATLYKPLSESTPTWAEAKITDIFKIISYSYTKKFYEVGSFSMVIPVNEPSAELLETNAFLATNDGDYLFVTGIKETENRITLEGYDLKYLLAGRVTLFPTEAQDVGAYGYYVTKGTTGECICDIVNHNIAEATDPNRRIYGFSVNSAPVGIANDTYMTRLEPLDQVVGTLCKNAGIGYDVEMRFDPVFGDSIAFRVIKPTDRSENQTDVPKVIFSKRFLNVETLSREIGVDAEKNAIYAVNGTNIDDAVVKLVNRGGEDKANYGVYRRETTVNVNCDIDEIDSYALKETEDFVAADSFVMDVMAAESYKRVWFVGDIVTFRHKELSRDAPIIAAEIQRTADKFTVKLSAGETEKKPVSAISKKADRASKENTQRKFDDVNVTNLLDNPDFKINQRGQSEYTGITYTVDRWRMFDLSSRIEVVNSGIKITTLTAAGTNSNTNALFQLLNHPVDTYSGKQLTLSLKATDTTGPWAICIRFGKSFPSGDYVTAIYQRMFSGVNRWTFTVPDQAISMRIGIIQHGPYGSTVGDTITVEWIKLELGSVATPFVPPNPATELLKCRRFFYRIGRNIPFFNPGNGIVINKDPSTHEVIGEGYLYLPTSMRVAPTIVSTPMMSFCNNEAYVPKSFTASFDSAHAIVSWTSVTVINNYPGLTIHDPCFLHLRDDVSIDFSADL